MGRKKKLINNTDIPQYAIERVARSLFDDIQEAYLKEEIQKAFAEWDREMRSMKIKRGLQEKKERAANTAALSVYLSFFLPLGPRGFDSRRINAPLGKYTVSYLAKKTNNPNPFPTGKSWFGLYCFGAGDRTRTGTRSPSRDFKSLVSTYSTTPAYYHIIVGISLGRILSPWCLPIPPVVVPGALLAVIRLRRSPTTATRSAPFFCHRQRSHRSPHQLVWEMVSYF